MNNFTPRAKQVLALARKEAFGFRHAFAGTEHLLLGLLRLGQGVSAQVLSDHGVTLETAVKEVGKLRRPPLKSITPISVPYSTNFKTVVNVGAKKEARALNHNFVGTEHFLLALLKSNTGAAEVFCGCNVDFQQMRADVLSRFPASEKPTQTPFGRWISSLMRGSQLQQEAEAAK